MTAPGIAPFHDARAKAGTTHTLRPIEAVLPRHGHEALLEANTSTGISTNIKNVIETFIQQRTGTSERGILKEVWDIFLVGDNVHVQGAISLPKASKRDLQNYLSNKEVNAIHDLNLSNYKVKGDGSITVGPNKTSKRSFSSLSGQSISNRNESQASSGPHQGPLRGLSTAAEEKGPRATKRRRRALKREGAVETSTLETNIAQGLKVGTEDNTTAASSSLIHPDEHPTTLGPTTDGPDWRGQDSVPSTSISINHPGEGTVSLVVVATPTTFPSTAPTVQSTPPPPHPVASPPPSPLANRRRVAFSLPSHPELHRGGVSSPAIDLPPGPSFAVRDAEASPSAPLATRRRAAFSFPSHPDLHQDSVSSPAVSPPPLPSSVLRNAEVSIPTQSSMRNSTPQEMQHSICLEEGSSYIAPEPEELQRNCTDKKDGDAPSALRETETHLNAQETRLVQSPLSLSHNGRQSIRSTPPRTPPRQSEIPPGANTTSTDTGVPSLHPGSPMDIDTPPRPPPSTVSGQDVIMADASPPVSQVPAPSQPAGQRSPADVSMADASDLPAQGPSTPTVGWRLDPHMEGTGTSLVAGHLLTYAPAAAEGVLPPIINSGYMPVTAPLWPHGSGAAQQRNDQRTDPWISSSPALSAVYRRDLAQASSFMGPATSLVSLPLFGNAILDIPQGPQILSSDVVTERPRNELALGPSIFPHRQLIPQPHDSNMRPLSINPGMIIGEQFRVARVELPPALGPPAVHHHRTARDNGSSLSPSVLATPSQETAPTEERLPALEQQAARQNVPTSGSLVQVGHGRSVGQVASIALMASVFGFFAGATLTRFASCG